MNPNMLRCPTTVGSLPLGASGYAPTSWWSAKQAEDLVASLMARGGLFGSKLPREAAERAALRQMRKMGVGITSGTVGNTLGSWLLPEKEQVRLLNKIDDVRFDIRLASRRAGVGLGLLAASLGVLGIASLYRTSRKAR